MRYSVVTLTPRTQEYPRGSRSIPSAHLPNGTLPTTHQPTRTTPSLFKPLQSRVSVRNRRELQTVALINAVLSWVVSILGYFVVTVSDIAQGTDWVKAAIIIISLVQTGFVFVKCRYQCIYLNDIKRLVTIEKMIYDSNYPSQWTLLRNAIFEGGFHMVVFIPTVSPKVAVTSYGLNSVFALDDAIYVLLLIRNYHTVEAIYWFSYMSRIRTYLFAHLVRVEVTYRFLFSCYLFEYPLRIVTGVIVGIVATPGLIEYLFVQVPWIQDYYTMWSEYWVISFTQVPVGYEDGIVNTLFGDASLLISVFTGMCLLGLLTSITMHSIDLDSIHSRIYSYLLYTKYKRKYLLQAVILTQRWWRLMEMRQKKRLHGPVIISYYSYLPTYRKVLTKCQRVKDHRFEEQINAFETAVRGKFRSMNEYLQPIQNAYDLIQDIIRSQYRLHVLTSNLLSQIRRCSGASSPHLAIPRHKKLQKGKSTYYSSQTLARAKAVALHNVRGRLINGNTTVFSLQKLRGNV